MTGVPTKGDPAPGPTHLFLPRQEASVSMCRHVAEQRLPAGNRSNLALSAPGVKLGGLLDSGAATLSGQPFYNRPGDFGVPREGSFFKAGGRP